MPRNSGLKCNHLHLSCCMCFIFIIIILLSFRTKSFENMDNKDNKKYFVLFYWDQCGHCKKMMPEWDDFVHKYHAKFPSNPPIILHKFEKNNTPSHFKHLNIDSFPTILLLDHHFKLIKSFDNTRTSSSFLSFLLSF